MASVITVLPGHGNTPCKEQTSIQLRHVEPNSSNKDTSSFVEHTHSIDLDTCIPEEPEDDAETASENNEPITPTDLQHPRHLLHEDLPKTDGYYPRSSKSSLKPLQPVDTRVANALTPQDSDPYPQQTASSTSSSQASPTTPRAKRSLSLLFSRSRSQSQQVMPATKLAVPQNGASETNLTKRLLSIRRRSATNSAVESPATTRSNSPPSPNSSTRNSVAIPDEREGDIRKNRSSVGFSNFRHKVTGFGQHGKAESIANGDIRKRATSVDLNQLITDDTSSSSVTPANATLGHRQPWGMPAQYGTGSKARRLSLSLPDNFNVDVIDLHKEYSDQSKIIGKRGKLLGRGATSRVTLMVRKGGPSNELYAVKEFRGKQSHEDATEYDSKIKSEFCISKSLHHPNIVETFHLGIDHGKWNHVMEYCEQGDLFNLVKQGHLKAAERLTDRLCLFKQLVQGVNYLHCNGIAHRDIKLENLLITNQSKLKITDFGVSEVFSGIHPGMRSAGGQCGKEMNEEIRLCCPGICGSEPYIAPEVLEKAGDYDPRPLDVWSSAIVMLHIIFGGALWTRAKLNDNQVQYEKVVKGWEKFNASSDTPQITESSYPYVDAFDKMIKPPALRRLLLGMLNPDPKKRYTIQEVAKKGWMKGIECCQVDSYDDPVVTIDAGKSGCCSGMHGMKVVQHNHLAPQHSKAHGIFVRTPGSTSMD